MMGASCRLACTTKIIMYDTNNFFVSFWQKAPKTPQVRSEAGLMNVFTRLQWPTPFIDFPNSTMGDVKIYRASTTAPVNIAVIKCGLLSLSTLCSSPPPPLELTLANQILGKT